MKPNLKLVVTEPCNRYHVTTEEQQIVNVSKALIRMIRAHGRKPNPNYAARVMMHMKRLDSAVASLEKIEKKATR